MKNILIFTLVLFSGFLYGQTPEQLSHLDQYYAKSLKEWNIPGMAIAIVKGDSIIFSKGYGYSNIQAKKKVDGNTLFAIASNSKAFTASAIAQLVDSGKLKWSDKVVDYLPYFKMYDPYVTAAFTIEDLLCHRSGLETFSGDLLWYGTTKTSEEVIIAAQHLEPKYDFRTHFGYSNIHYIAAGQVIEKVTGQKWTTYIQEHFLTPLNMNHTLTSTIEIKNTKNVASPYFFENGINNELKWVNWDNVAPAGALISSVNDYAQWIKMNLQRGIYKNKKFISEKQFERMVTPHVNYVVRKSTKKTEMGKHFSGYGLGWGVADMYGAKIISHGGGYDGMISKSCVIPEKEIGFIILTNNLSWAPSAIYNKTIDVLIGNNKKGEDWSAKYLGYKMTQDSTKKVESEKVESERVQFPLGFSLDQYAGTYQDKMYGSVQVSFKEGKLSFKMKETPIFYADLKHWNHDIFTFRFPTKLASLPMGKLWFDLDAKGEISTLHIYVPNPDFYFEEFEFKKNKNN